MAYWLFLTICITRCDVYSIIELAFYINVLVSRNLENISWLRPKTESGFLHRVRVKNSLSPLKSNCQIVPWDCPSQSTGSPQSTFPLQLTSPSPTPDGREKLIFASESDYNQGSDYKNDCPGPDCPVCKDQPGSPCLAYCSDDMVKWVFCNTKKECQAKCQAKEKKNKIISYIILYIYL